MKLSKTRLFCLSYFSLLLAPSWAFAAACCGGGFALPSLILGDEKAQLSASYSQMRIVDDVGADSLWRRREERESSEVYRIDGAHIFADSWQVGASLPVVRRALPAHSASGLGDLSASLGYEILPDWDFSPWRPKGLAYLQLVFPTGRYASEARDPFQLDARGRGFWAVGLGTVLSKVFGDFDLNASLEVHRSFPKTFRNSQGGGTLRPGFGGVAGFGGGYSLGSFRLGPGLSWAYEDAVDVAGPAGSRGTLQRFTTASLAASWLFSRAWAATVSYSDQTLFGRPLNASLSRGGSLVVQRRWER